MNRKVFVHDPWGIRGPGSYTYSLCNALYDYGLDVHLITNQYYKYDELSNFKVIKIFFRYSEKMKINKIRKIIQGIEYIVNMVRLLFIYSKDNPDIIHIQLTSKVLVLFMIQFDTCLITYNFKKNSNLTRFQTSFPTRFLIALVVGIPVILPQSKFEAMENFLKREGIGYAFKDSRDAYLTLKNPNWEETIKKSKFKQKHFIFNSSEFLLFINNFLQKGKCRYENTSNHS